MFKIGDRVSLDEILEAGWIVDSYSIVTKTCHYVNEDNSLCVEFANGDQFGIVCAN